MASNNVRRRYQFQSRRSGDTWIVTATGQVTVAAFKSARTYMSKLQQQSDCRAFIFDLRGAVLLATYADLKRLGSKYEAEPVEKRPPVAHVVSEAEIDTFDEYCRCMSIRGKLRVAFTEYEDALDWSRRTRAHWRQKPEEKARADTGFQAFLLKASGAFAPEVSRRE